MANQILAVVRHQGLQNLLTENAVNELQNLSWHKTSEILMDAYESHAGSPL